MGLISLKKYLSHKLKLIPVRPEKSVEIKAATDAAIPKKIHRSEISLEFS